MPKLNSRQFVVIAIIAVAFVGIQFFIFGRSCFVMISVPRSPKIGTVYIDGKVLEEANVRTSPGIHQLKWTYKASEYTASFEIHGNENYLFITEEPPYLERDGNVRVLNVVPSKAKEFSEVTR